MRQSPQEPTHFGPAKNGVAWPYMLVTIIGALLSLYLAVELYIIFSEYHATPPSDYIFVVALLGIGLAFAAATIAFWFYPWSWSSVTIDQTGVTISVTGWGGFPEAHLAWSDLAEVSVFIMPRGASLLTFHTKIGLTKSIRTWSVAVDTNELLAVLGQYAKEQGLAFIGPPLKTPILWRRSWSVRAT